MELRQLRYFVTVVEEANFTRAAARLHLAQPGLSAQIRQLERELGQPLLERGARSVTLTPVGAAVLPHARAALAAVEQVTDTVDEFTGLLRGQVRLGFVSGIAGENFDLAAVLAAFHSDHPQVGISLSEHTSEEMLDALRHGDLDIALIGLTGTALDATFGVDIVLDTAVVAAVAPDSEPSRTRITLAELAERRLICLPRGTGLRGVLEHACAAAGLEPEVAFEAANPGVLLQLASHGLGTAVVPALTAQEAAEFGVHTLEITDPQLRGQLALVWRRDRPGNPATKVLLGQLRIALTP
ncbi:LysR family transcriptional regulator [Nocardia sp. XZ_19_385]|uniref:LysR family transcriptional regulator n=1 Tax=Nocardia sp. XZ_19_385 TaxID=2769488 RepID=UPI00188E580B|nr:LysR family transcriptional regulator [Nocardia sp. XZ_19_385]